MRRLPLLLAAALAAAAVAVAAAAPAEVGAPHPLLFLHLSDIHYSVNVRKYWASFGDREGDAALWAQQVVPRLRPAAVLVTGDITDSKVGGDWMRAPAALRSPWLAHVYAGTCTWAHTLQGSGRPPTCSRQTPSCPRLSHTLLCRPPAARACSRRWSGWATLACYAT